MKKLIVKSQLLDRGAFERQIAGIGMEMSPVIWQHERVYLPSEWRPNMNYPRLVMRTEVRTTEQPAEYFMYLKRHIEDSGVDYVNFTRVGDYTEATGMIHQLGFRKAAEVSRQRREVWLDNRTVIYLDEVEGVQGPFLKIEAEMDENESVEALRTDLFTILSMLGQKAFTMQAYFQILNGEMQQFLLPAAE
jgi:predicted adenylyl cyclase CyaB